MARAGSMGEPIGELIRRLRKERGLTQQTLADRVQCSRSLIQQIESGARIPQLSLRERLSLVLGESLPATGRVTHPPDAADAGLDALRMRFNVLLGRDPAAATRALDIAQSLIEAEQAPEPLHAIAVRQLRRAEEALAQVPSSSATIWEWNTVRDWLTILAQATRSVRAVHVAALGSIGGEAGDDYHAAMVEIASRSGAARVDMRRIYILDAIEELWPYEDKLWRLTRAGVENLVVKGEHARGVTGMLIVDDRFLALGEYDHRREGRVATRLSALRHDVTFGIRRFEKLYDLKRSGAAISVGRLLGAAPFTRFARLGEEDSRELFRAALTESWVAIPDR
ncbi:helix-turn-helix transcriptional regulator [Nocardia sp. NPDC057668]|uniref:helix-turn-helix transcriptional regulator n=1 Tax=Nocardia sp. NPDC057668 TaxID=3346202 RepID=UPI0036721EEC